MKRTTTEETQRPGEWLLRFVEDRSRYQMLLTDSGKLSVAAYRLARARCRIQPVPTGVPTQMELWAAARRIVVHTGATELLPSKRHLAGECEALGMPVIGPIAAYAA